MIIWPLMIKAWIFSLSLTLVFELFYSFIYGIRNRNDLILVILVNFLTNPVVVFVHYFVRFRHMNINYGLVTLVMEVLAVVTEAVLYQKYGRTFNRPWLFSLNANAFSFAIGELINNIV